MIRQVDDAFRTLQTHLSRWDTENTSENEVNLRTALTQAREVVRQECAGAAWAPQEVAQLEQQCTYAETRLTLHAQEQARRK